MTRYVAVNDENMVNGWVALSPTSNRFVYRGVAEVNIYVAEASRKQNLGYMLMNKLIEETEKKDIGTLYSSIISINEASIKLHNKCGFRVVGTRERIAKDVDGIWQDTTIMERRSKIAGV
jgi:L-amino acid N-acyltransferase YncA